MANEKRIALLLGYLGANVRFLRKKAGLTQDMLAGMAEIDLRFLQKVEYAQTNMSIRVFFQLAESLGVPPGTLLRPALRPQITRGRPPKAVLSPAESLALKAARRRIRGGST